MRIIPTRVAASSWLRGLALTLGFVVAAVGVCCQVANAADQDLSTRIRQLEEKLRDYDALRREVGELKQQLREQEAARRAAEQPPPSVTVQAPPAPLKPGPPFEVRVGRGTVQLGGLLQVWDLHSDVDPDEFRLRRSEINLKGKIIDSVGYTIMIDPAKNLSENKTIVVGDEQIKISQPKSDSKILQDLFLSFGFIPHHLIDVGQRKIPVSMEGLESSAKLDFAERAIVSGATFRGVRGVGDFRDPGVQLTGDWPHLVYTVGVFNGEGPNASDKNDRKDVGERVVVKPFSWLQLGGSRYDGWFGSANAVKMRSGAELKFEYQDVFLKGEFIRARDGAFRKEGWYVSTGYRFRGLQLGNVAFDLQPAVRFERFDPDIDTSDNAIAGPTAGVNILFDDYYAKIQLDYTHFDVGGQEDDNLFIGAFQVAF